MIGSGLNQMMPDIMLWLGWGLLIVALGLLFWFAYLWIAYKYKTEIYIRRNTGNSKDFSIGKIKWDLMREVKQGTIVKWKLLFTRKIIQPIDDKYILPGNKVKLFQTGSDTFFPVDFRCGNPEAILSPIPLNIKLWQQLETQQAISDTENKSFMEKYGSLVIMSTTVLFCLVLVGFTIYYSYQYVNQGFAEVSTIWNTAPQWVDDLAPR